MYNNDAEKYIENHIGDTIQNLTLFPKFFLLETVNFCNANCIMCGIDFKKKAKQTISDALFKKVINEISDYKDHVEKVMLYLDGEPLLDKCLVERIQYTKKKGIKIVNIASNASKLDQETSKNLINAGLDEIYITIDSTKKEVYEKIRRGLNFDTVKENVLNFINIRNQLNNKLKIRIQMIKQPLNLEEADLFQNYWLERLGLNDQVVIQKSHNWASKVEVMKYGDESDVNTIPCIALWGTFVMHVDGEVPLCCMDSKTTIKIGDINKNSIKDIWKGRKIDAIRNKHLKNERADIPLCNGCTLWRISKKEMQTK